MQDIVQPGIVHHSFFGRSYRPLSPEFFRSLEIIQSDPLFAAVEIDFIDNLSANEVEDIASALGEDHRIVVSGGTVLNRGGYNLSSIDDQERAAAVSKALSVVEFCAQVGAEACVLPSGRDPGDHERPRAREMIRDSLYTLCERGAETLHDVVITIEQMDRTFHHRQLLGPTDETVPIISEVRKDYDNIGLTFDLAHCAQLSEDPLLSLAVARDILYQIHLGNCVMEDESHPLYGDKHPPFDIPGGVIGERDLVTFLRSSVEQKILRPGLIMSLEVNTPEGECMYATYESARESFVTALRGIASAG